MKKSYKLIGVDCANCAQKMESGIKKLDGVNSCSINFILQKLTIDFEGGDAEPILKKAADICKRIDRNAEIIAK